MTILSSAGAVLATSGTAEACTAICRFEQSARVSCADDFVWGTPIPGAHVYVSPAGVSKTALLSGPGSAASWTARYETMYVARLGPGTADRIINSQGLFGTLHTAEDWDGVVFQRDANKQDVPSVQLLNYLADTSATVDEAFQSLQNVNALGGGAQFLLCDHHKCAAVEWRAGSVKLTEIVPPSLASAAGAVLPPPDGAAGNEITAYANSSYAHSMAFLRQYPNLTAFSDQVPDPENIQRFPILANVLAEPSTWQTTPIAAAILGLNHVMRFATDSGTRIQMAIDDTTWAIRTQRSFGGPLPDDASKLMTLPLALMNRQCTPSQSVSSQVLSLDVTQPSSGGDASPNLQAYSEQDGYNAIFSYLMTLPGMDPATSAAKATSYSQILESYTCSNPASPTDAKADNDNAPTAAASATGCAVGATRGPGIIVPLLGALGAISRRRCHDVSDTRLRARR
jgi:hypothetical protein